MLLSFVVDGKILLVCLIVVLLSAGCDNKGSSTLVASANQTANWPSSFGFGHPATKEEIAKLDIDIMPDGRGLPAGAGTAEAGENVYQVKCASCHGKNGTEGPANKLVGAVGDTTKAKTIGNYWPYATTLFDYIRRAMPYNMPGSLNDSEVYSLTAFLLNKNKIIDSAVVIDAASLPKVKMPAQKLFVNDDRHGGAEVR